MTEEEKRRTVRITNIQRFCLHDGPGIRTTIFLKGCSIHCPWCCNPENISYEIQPWRDPDTGETGTYGYDISLEDLEKELLKDRDFYLDGGGITFSGGEPLLQIEKYVPLLRELKAEKIHLAVETALFVDKEFVEMALPYIDWWYVDMKLPEPSVCRQLLGGDVAQYRKNLRLVSQNASELHIRIPCCSNYTDSEENMRCILQPLRGCGIKEVELLEVHHLGDAKRASMGLPVNQYPEQNKRAMDKVTHTLERVGISCKTMLV